jgi:hypothetical protein
MGAMQGHPESALAGTQVMEGVMNGSTFQTAATEGALGLQAEAGVEEQRQGSHWEILNPKH